MARKTNTSAVEAYIDAALEAATDERSHARSTASVSESASSSFCTNCAFEWGVSCNSPVARCCWPSCLPC